ncbi:MAG: RNA polymerase sigma-70 factor [Bacteroidales bacterium]|nr:RNA polymerase sigma-70 factor [Bacteroidales bacterium]
MDIPFVDQLLVNNIKKGDVSSFEIVFKRYYKKLCVYAEDFVKEKSMAEEIVSDIFYKLWENRENIHISGSIQAYLFASVHNNSIKYLEHLKVLKRYNEFATKALQNQELLNVSGSYPIANLISKEIEADINKAIEALPDQCKQIFCMHRFKDLSYEEIAQKMDLSINTVRTQMMRALKKLRESLKEYLPCFVFLILNIF